MGQFAAPSQQITHSEKLFMQLSAMSTARSTPRYRWLEVPAAAIVGCVHFSTASLVMNTKGLNLFLERTTREQYPRIVVERKFIRLLVSWLYRNILSNSVPTDCCETRLNFRGGGRILVFKKFMKSGKYPNYHCYIWALFEHIDRFLSILQDNQRAKQVLFRAEAFLSRKRTSAQYGQHGKGEQSR